MTTATASLIESVMGGRGSSASSEDGWDLTGIPPRFWPKIRLLLEARASRHSTASSVVASALVNALAIQAIAKSAGGAGESLSKAAGSMVAEWDGELCPPYRKWPPKKKRFIAEEVVEILSEVLEVIPEGALSSGIRNLGASMSEKLAAGML